MDILDQLKRLSAGMPSLLEKLGQDVHEEATKNALIMPFIQALGYNVFDPTEVQPEFTADVPKKRGKPEKVDYALLKDGTPTILIECKKHGSDLNREHCYQLIRYFTTTDVHFGILTNGIVYKFYSDIDAPNRMDKEPFLELDMLNIDAVIAEEVTKFSKLAFNKDELVAEAKESKYRRNIQQFFDDQLSSPSPEFIKFLAERFYQKEKRVTTKVLQLFTVITKQALHQFLDKSFCDRLKPVMSGTSESKTPQHLSTLLRLALPADEGTDGNEPSLTEEEREAYYIVKAILWEVVDSKRLTWHHSKKHGVVLLDKKTSQPICKLWLNSPDKSISIVDAAKTELEKKEISNLDEIFSLSEKLKASMASYEALHEKVPTGVSN